MKQLPNIVLATITGIIVIVAIIAAVFASRDHITQWPPDSPEATVQTYVQAVVDQDYAAALRRMDPTLACSVEHFDQSYYPQDTAISLFQAETQADRATVTVEIGSYGDPLFDTFVHQEQFELIQGETGWLITGSPWPVYICAGELL